MAYAHIRTMLILGVLTLIHMALEETAFVPPPAYERYQDEKTLGHCPLFTVGLLDDTFLVRRPVSQKAL